MHDVVIRGGTIIDGTGRKGFAGDLAIEGERIVAMGGKAAPGKREIDATGLLVTPGWLDMHTHYDGQATWDPILAPSSWHGVTTLMFGNCGVGFAPVRAEHRDALLDIMEGVEEIPGIALAEGLAWNWESFPEFLDVLEQFPRAIDVAAQIAHHPLRVYVMGERAVRLEAATATDIAAMRALTLEALKAGAFGFTTSRTTAHKTKNGEMVPARYAEPSELVGIGQALGDAGAGAFGMNSDFDEEAAEIAWMTQLAKETGRPVWFLLTDKFDDPSRWRRLLSEVHRARADGAQLLAQVSGRAIGVILGIGLGFNPLSIRPSYSQLSGLPRAEQLKRLRDPEMRRIILADRPSPEELRKLSGSRPLIASQWDRMFVMGNPPDYEPPPEASIASIAARLGLNPDEVAYDYLTEEENRFLFFPLTNYTTGDDEPIRKMLVDDASLLGLSDGGAHCASIVDAGVPSYMLTHWARDRKRGPRLPLETVIRYQTGDPADFFGLTDRGRLAPGLRADVNLIDFDGMRIHAPELVHDLPAGGQRLVQRVDGYEVTFVAGAPIFEKGEHTGALPGRLVRAGR
jgi:N-acyl-D-aspartate/D-glutamate deacylase